MNTTPYRHLALLAVITLLLSACGSTAHSNYYLLSASGDREPAGQSPSLGIGPIEIPEYLNRNGLVYNQEGNQLHIASHERWAEPIANGVERVFSLNLASLLNTENVQSYPWPRSEVPDYAVQVSLKTLDANDSQATLIAEWVLETPGDSGVVIRRLTRLYYDMPPGELQPGQIAPAYSALLHQLSKLVAAEISRDMTEGK